MNWFGNVGGGIKRKKTFVGFLWAILPKLQMYMPCHLNPMYTLTRHFFKAHFNITLTSTSRSYEWFLLLRFSNKNIKCISEFRIKCNLYIRFILSYWMTLIILLNGTNYKTPHCVAFIHLSWISEVLFIFVCDEPEPLCVQYTLPWAKRSDTKVNLLSCNKLLVLGPLPYGVSKAVCYKNNDLLVSAFFVFLKGITHHFVNICVWLEGV